MKHIVEEIWKIAQAGGGEDLSALPNLPPPKNAPAAPPSSPSGTGGGGMKNVPPGPGDKKPAAKPRSTYRPGNKAVIEMQKAIQKFADYIINDVKYSDLPTINEPDIKRQPSSEERNRGSFMDFFAQNFVGELSPDKRGVEWTDDPSATTQEQKQKGETSVYQMKVVMDTISRIGTSSKEFKPDGLWGFRTHNALKNIMGFGFALLQLSREMNVKSNSFTTRQWLNFSSKLNSIKVEGKKVILNSKEQTMFANLFTKDIYAILSLYKDIREQVIGNPKFRPYLEEDRAFGKVTAEDPEQKKALEKRKRGTEYYAPGSELGDKYVAVQIPNYGSFAVPFYALSNSTAYLDWAVNKARISKDQAVSVFTGFIKPEIDKLYKQYKSQQPAPAANPPETKAPEATTAPAAPPEEVK